MLLILCPLSIELKSVLEAIKADGHAVRNESIDNHNIFFCDELGWALSLGGHGKVQFAVHTQFWLHRYKHLRAVICLGACGALSPTLKTQDLVIATKTVEHDFKERFLSRPLPEFAADPLLLSRFQNLNIDVHFGPIASGDEDILDAGRAEEIVKQTSAIAVAWEGAGGARACKFSKIPFLEIRGVTDSANSEALPHFQANVSLVMKRAYPLLKAAFAQSL